ncbi:MULTISPECIES: hypothetical protein [Rhizobium]|uniref:hypothetical protein n=1 Tax=Rhizobium TaxID=379 RepID=UPI0010321494|nr:MULTISPECIES: hypothetical protein [Rhizobium]TBF24864.1 hypothetical protein ELG88_33695 [Rhizobium leguminosarum]WSH48955.1 hypothetical protein U8P77_35250 [Rhizobium johnstonii]
MRPVLYYPYIRIRNLNWLKGTLLIYPNVYRMVPDDFSPWDDRDGTLEFAQTSRGGEALLARAEIGSPRSVDAQSILAEKLKKDIEDPEFCRRYNQTTARQLQLHDGYGVQLHKYKISKDIRGILESAQLSWKPHKYEPDDPTGDLYIEVHEHIGEAIMSTIAIACADYHGANVVAEPRAEKLHRCLVEKKLDEIYDAWLHPKRQLQAPAQQTGESAFEFMIEFSCDLSALRACDIVELGDDREAIKALLEYLNKQVSEISMDSRPQLERSMKDAISGALNQWESDRKLLSNVGKKLLGAGSIKPGADFFKKIYEKASAPAMAGGGAIIGGLTSAGIMGALGGIAIGVVPTVLAVREKQKTSPLRYLTAMTRAGIKLNVPLQIKGHYDSDEAALQRW